jgi:hypothetical protein
MGRVRDIDIIVEDLFDLCRRDRFLAFFPALAIIARALARLLLVRPPHY